MSRNIPQLRFAEFSGEWQETTLGNICEMQAGKFISASEIHKLQNANMYPCYGGNGLRGYTDTATHKGKYPLIGRQGALCGNVMYASGGFYATEHAVVVSAKSTIDTHWLFYQLIRLNLNQYATGQAQPGLSVETIKKIPLRVPCYTNEQKQIGSFLSAVDSKIEGLEQELGLLKRYKQGIMQRLFNQTLRFKDNHGKPFPDWQDVSIKEIGEVITGSTPSKTNDGFWEGSFPWVTAQDFKSKYISATIQTLSEQGKKKSRIIPKNSVLITCIASIGLNAINKVECATNQQINAIVCNKKYDSEFIYYAIGFNNRSLKNLAGQTAVPIVTKTAFESFRLFVAKDKVEQKKIADFLSAIDEKIEAKQNQITTARNWKKSLLQKMFV